ncbi:hypothetical protein DH2020_004597 [Rehmannia glutinosa]|uniref:Uncharacterized protein n=1 Tax=Rehmannia glutinosa TaxID=99300 RepID=A0ABR0XPV2_REHGL
MYSSPSKVGDESMNVQKDNTKEENTVKYSIDSHSKGENLVSDRCGSELDPEQTPISNVGRLRASSSCRELFVPNIHGLHSSIPKHITTFDEKYVLRCLELLRNCALRAAASNFTSKVHILPDDWSNLAESKIKGSCDMARLAIECPLVANSTDDWSIGSVTGSQSMMNILKNPLLQQFGSVDFGRKSLVNISEQVYSDFVGSPHELNNTSTQKPEKEVKDLDHKYVTPPGHKRLFSISSINSTCSNKSSSSASATSFQGMLQCTWKDGLPHHVFSVDDKREVFVANLSKAEASDDKGLDYVYTIRTRKKGRKKCDVQELDLQSVGSIRVSTSITLCSNNSLEVRETHFVLSLSDEDPTDELQISNLTLRKSKRLSSKVVNVFRSNHSYKQRSSSKFWGSSAIFEDSPYEPSEDVHNSIETRVEKQKHYVPNLELAAIIVKDVCKNREEDSLGGWGLKFLKKLGKETIVPSESTRDYGECSTSLDVLIPAGLHGGPKTRAGGPSSLTERWISGGRCDCGGWDIGCPLTVLNTASSDTSSSFLADNSGECKSVDLFMQGSKQDVPIFKMANIHEGLYYIHFQSTLSTLQSFAIAAAIIHSRNPNRPMPGLVKICSLFSEFSHISLEPTWEQIIDEHNTGNDSGDDNESDLNYNDDSVSQYLSDYESDDNFEVDNWSDDGFTNEMLGKSSSNKEFRVPDDPTERPKLEKGMQNADKSVITLAVTKWFCMKYEISVCNVSAMNNHVNIWTIYPTPAGDNK